MTERAYPDETAGPFPAPPRTMTDREGRTVTLRAVGEGEDAVDTESAREALFEMYEAFDPADRAQGLPPAGESRIRDWLDNVLDEGRYNVIASVEGEAAGHATLVPDVDSYELAIFVLQDYQQAGIGTALIETLLGHGADRGVERVWLTVERWNSAAVHLYEKVGFETCDSESFELEMALRLA
jgi:ribosomal protein S18 acetylase RimI-like enzyme